MAFDRLRLQRTGMAAVGGALLLGMSAAMPVRAAEDTNTFNSFLGFFGMQAEKEQDSIDYRARAPLVVPPKLDLPPPQAADARHPADWPTDPDIAARRKALVDSHRPAPQVTLNTRPEQMTRDQMAGGRTETVRVDNGDDGCQALGGASSCSGSPWQYVKEKLGLAKKEDDVVLSSDVPPRKYLTEPPSSYRVPTVKTKVTVDPTKAEPDNGDAQAYSRHEQTHKTSVDDQ